MLIPLLILIAAIGSTAIPSNTWAEEGSAVPAYTTYGACAVDVAAMPSHFCHKSDELAAFFRSNTASVLYEVCVDFQLAQKQVCAEPRQTEVGTLYGNKITDSVGGGATVTWLVDSVPVGTWRFGIYPDPFVSKFGINPLIVFEKHRLFGLLIKNGGNAPRVRAWTTCGNGNICPLGLKLTTTHGDVRRFVVSTPPGGAHFDLGELLYVLLDAPGQSDGHGSGIWGRLYTGKFVRSPHGAAGDTAIRHLGPLRCVPPRRDFKSARSCDEAP